MRAVDMQIGKQYEQYQNITIIDLMRIEKTSEKKRERERD